MRHFIFPALLTEVQEDFGAWHVPSSDVLILQLQAQGLGEARRVTFCDGRYRARGASCQRKTPSIGAPASSATSDRLQLMPDDIRAVRQSWINLHDSMRSRNIAGTLRSAEISTWKNQTIQHFGAVRVGTTRSS